MAFNIPKANRRKNCRKTFSAPLRTSVGVRIREYEAEIHFDYSYLTPECTWKVWVKPLRSPETASPVYTCTLIEIPGVGIEPHIITAHSAKMHAGLTEPLFQCLARLAKPEPLFVMEQGSNTQEFQTPAARALIRKLKMKGTVTDQGGGRLVFS